MADMPKWFDYAVYMNNKLAQMQRAEPDANWTMSKLVDVFAENGFIGEDGAYSHFAAYGANEEVSPNAYFNAEEYYAAKAAEFYKVAPEALTELQIADVKVLIHEAGMNAWTHYVQYGSNEGVNPSNSFDASDYLAAKAAVMGGDWTAESVGKAIADAGMTVLEHYLTYAGTSSDEVPADATFPVPAEEQVPSDNPGLTYTLTTGIDTIDGTSGNDTILGSDGGGAPASVLGGLDVIDGGAGNDTMKIDDAKTAAGDSFSFNGATIKNVENIIVATNGAFGDMDLTGYEGLEHFTGKAAGSAGSSLKAADTTDVDLTVVGSATAKVEGGQAVNVTAGTGTTTITGAALTEVTVKGGGEAGIDNTNAAGASAKGTTLTSVTLDGVDAASTIKGEGLESVTVKGATEVARTVTITNAKADHALTVNVDGTGYDKAGGEKQTTVVDANATAITVNATGDDSSLSLTGSTAVRSLNITGDADLTLKASDLAALTTIDGSTATGDLDLGTLNAKTATVKTGAGDDAFTLNATTKVTVDAGDGDDTVTLGAVIAAGSTINLGAGDDALLGVAKSVTPSTQDATTVIDGGDGFDTVSAAMINVTNAALFHNFEALDLSSTVSSLDVDLMTASTIESLTLSGSNGAATVSNVAAGVDLLVSGVNTETTTINVKGAATGTADAFTVTFDDVAEAAATTPTAVSANVALNGIENLTVESTGTGLVANTLAVADNSLQSVTITGDKALTLTFESAPGNAVKLIDGSAATGNLDINTSNLMADAKLGLTVKTGAGDDTITLAQKATVDAGAGDDTITSSAGGGSFTGGEGKDTFDVKLAKAGATSLDTMVISTVTDFSVGDTLTMGGAATAFTKITLTDAVQDFLSALNLAAETADITTWFQYGNDTYIVANDNTDDLSTGDVVVKLTGTNYDFDGATLDSGTGSLHLA